MTQPIGIEGLREFSRNLRKLDNDLPKALRLAMNAAGDIVVGLAKPQVPRRSGRAAGSVRSKSTRTAVRVAGGGRRAPHYPWLDFGGRVGRRRSVHRPFLEEGRYLYASYFEALESGRFQEVLQAELLEVARKAGVEVNTGGG